MSRREPRAERPEPRGGALHAYLHRFFTCWVAEDPGPAYSALDRSDGLGQDPDPVCQPVVQVPESGEVVDHVRSAERVRSAVAGRSSR
jgi:hypothetical protein